MKKILFIFLFSLAGINYFGLEAKDITLVSSDKKKFKLPKAAAELSTTIKSMLEDIGGDRITLKQIDGKTLERIVAVANAQIKMPVKMPGKKGKKLLDALAPFLPKDQEKLVDILIAANYLDYPTLLNVAARELAKNLPSNWQTSITVRDIHPLIAKYYYLISGRNLAGVDEKSYGFSIRELMAYGRFDRKVITSSGKLLLNLSNMRINDLDGLMDIPEIKTVQELNLSGNQLKDLQIGLFNGLGRLKFLYLSNNQLKDLSVGVFNGLSSLQSLILSRNQLSTLPAGVFNELDSLKRLYLENNQLSSLSVDVLNRLGSLELLILSRNQLRNLQARVFNELNNLKRLDLSGNQLNPDNKEQIKKALPNVKVYF